MTVSSAEDFGREVLKSDTAGIAIPELELELEEGSLDGVYSTVEGLLKKLVSNMEAANPFASGDSSKKHHVGNDAEGGKFGEQSLSQKYDTFMAKLRTLSEGKSVSSGLFFLIVSFRFFAFVFYYEEFTFQKYILHRKPWGSKCAPSIF